MERCDTTRALWCLRKLIVCEGENVVNYVMACQCLILGDLTLGNSIKDPCISLIEFIWDEAALNLIVDVRVKFTKTLSSRMDDFT